MEKRNSYLINKAFNSFLLASLLTVAATQVGATIDGMMMSYLIDEQAMSSVNICRPVMQLLFSLCMLIGAGGSMLVGMAIGKRDRQKANSIFSAVVSLLVTLGMVFLAVAVVWLEPLVAFLCPDIELRGITAEFLSVTLYGSVFYLLSTVMQMFVAVDGNPKRVTLAVISCAATNLLLDYVFIAICGWGVSGAAWATVISYVVPVLTMVPHFMRRDTLKLSFGGCLATLPDTLLTGLPFGLATMLIAVQIWGNNNIVMNYLGQNGIIALAVCFYLLGLSMIILTGTLKAFQPVASILKGADDSQGVLIVIRRAYRFMSVCLGVFVLPMITCPRWVAMAFGVSDESMLNMTATAVPAFAVNIIFQCLVYLLIPIYQLYRNKGMATFISVMQSLAPMFGMWLLAEVAPRFVWWGFALGQLAVTVCVLSAAALKRKRDSSVMPVLLIPCGEKTVGFETSIKADLDALNTSLGETDIFLKSHIADSSLRMRIELTTEELLKNIITHGYEKNGKKHYIDCRLSVLPDRVSMVVSDDGKAFNPVEYDKETGLGLLLVRGMCDDIKYDYLFHQNITTVSFEYKNAL